MRRAHIFTAILRGSKFTKRHISPVREKLYRGRENYVKAIRSLRNILVSVMVPFFKRILEGASGAGRGTKE